MTPLLETLEKALRDQFQVEVLFERLKRCLPGAEEGDVKRLLKEALERRPGDRQLAALKDALSSEQRMRSLRNTLLVRYRNSAEPLPAEENPDPFLELLGASWTEVGGLLVDDKVQKRETVRLYGREPIRAAIVAVGAAPALTTELLRSLPRSEEQRDSLDDEDGFGEVEFDRSLAPALECANPSEAHLLLSCVVKCARRQPRLAARENARAAISKALPTLCWRALADVSPMRASDFEGIEGCKGRERVVAEVVVSYLDAREDAKGRLGEVFDWLVILEGMLERRWRAASNEEVACCLGDAMRRLSEDVRKRRLSARTATAVVRGVAMVQSLRHLGPLGLSMDMRRATVAPADLTSRLLVETTA